jgi:hypothetical protein
MSVQSVSLKSVLDQIDNNLPAATDRLLEFLRIPSVSTDPAFAAHCQTAADWLVADLQSIGAEATKRDTPGHPMVVGHVAGEGPHILFMGITMCSQWIRSISGIVTHLIPPSKKHLQAA